MSYLEWVDESQIIQCNIIVIILDVTECFLVILHQSINLAVLPLFNLMNLGFSPEILLISLSSHLLLILLLNLPCLSLKVVTQLCDFLVMVLKYSTNDIIKDWTLDFNNYYWKKVKFVTGLPYYPCLLFQLVMIANLYTWWLQNVWGCNSHG